MAKRTALASNDPIQSRLRVLPSPDLNSGEMGHRAAHSFLVVRHTKTERGAFLYRSRYCAPVWVCECVRVRAPPDLNSIPRCLTDKILNDDDEGDLHRSNEQQARASGWMAGWLAGWQV